MRQLLDKFFQFGIKLCLLTGVAFTFAACYGPAPEPREGWNNDPDYNCAQQKMEQQLHETASEISPVAGELASK